MDLMKKKVEELNNSNSGGKNSYIKFEVGDEKVLRIVPTEDGDPFKSAYLYYGLGVSPFLSPSQQFGEDDPIYEFRKTLWEDGSEEAKKQARKLKANQRFYSPVIVRGEEDKGVQIWSYSKSVYQWLIEDVILNEDYGDITDIHNGNDIRVKKVQKPDDQYPSFSTTVRPRKTPLHDDEEVVNEWLKNTPDISPEVLHERKTPEEVQKILDNFMGSESESEKYGFNDPEGDGFSDDHKPLTSDEQKQQDAEAVLAQL